MVSNNINIRTDKETKDEAERIFKELGLTMSTAINMFLRQVIRVQGIPFEIKLDTPNAETEEALLEYEAMKDKTQYPRYDSFSDLVKEIIGDAENHKVE